MLVVIHISAMGALLTVNREEQFFTLKILILPFLAIKVIRVYKN